MVLCYIAPMLSGYGAFKTPQKIQAWLASGPLYHDIRSDRPNFPKLRERDDAGSAKHVSGLRAKAGDLFLCISVHARRSRM